AEAAPRGRRARDRPGARAARAAPRHPARLDAPHPDRDRDARGAPEHPRGRGGVAARRRRLVGGRRPRRRDGPRPRARRRRALPRRGVRGTRASRRLRVHLPGSDGRRAAPGARAEAAGSRRRALDRIAFSRIIDSLFERSEARMTDQDDLIRRAAQVLPGGVLGSHRSGPGLEFVVKEGRGAYLWDMNGRRYLDYLLGSGPMLLGHAHAAVVAAVERQMARGTSYFLLNEPAIQLAEEIVRAVPCAEQVRYTSSGSEATFFAHRVARAFRNREKIL